MPKRNEDATVVCNKRPSEVTGATTLRNDFEPNKTPWVWGKNLVSRVET